MDIMDMKGQRIGYTRVSSIGQEQARQLEGVELDKLFSDISSGKDVNRPALQEMLQYIREGDIVFIHSMDRLGRNLMDLWQLVDQLTNKRVEVRFIKEQISLTGNDTPMSKLLLSVMGAFAEFERALIKERQAEGIAIAKRQGKYKGRKPSLTSSQIEDLCKRVEKGEKKAHIARQLGISRETLYRYLRDASNHT